MKYFNQLGLVLFIQFVGVILNKYVISLVPSTVLGMIILFLLLLSKIIKIEDIREFSEFLLMNLAFFFIPPSISLMNSWGILSANLLKIFVIVIITTFITMIVTGKTIDFLINRKEKKNGDS
ncbi:MAG: CidA/LrgA family protein [Fusobacteriaceae bacterium]|nr:CidA/LrgA family protein [Fusobacteriaceae bacterium]MBN2837811.1 CidA/LrgA family protein [Fusobacteriaceae bacterium]